MADDLIEAKDEPESVPQHLEPDPRLVEGISYPWRAFVVTYSESLTDGQAERLADALLRAITPIAHVIRRPHILKIGFGSPPAYKLWQGTGTLAYIPDLSQDPIGTASHDTIFFDARRLLAMPTIPFDIAAICILEELVHAWMNVTSEPIAKSVTAWLYGGLRVEGEQYVPAEPTPDGSM